MRKREAVMRLISSTIGVATIFGMAWLVLCQAGMAWLVPVWAVVWTALAGGVCLYLWQRGGELDIERPGRVSLVFLLLAVGIALFLLVDALGTGTSLLDPSQWTKLLNSKGVLGFTTTAILGLLVISMAVATFVRIAVLRILESAERRLVVTPKGPPPS
jgi:hypothetical protein